MLKTLTSWAQRDNALQESVTFTDKTKIGYNYSDPGGKNALASKCKSCRPETMTAENQYAYHDLSV